MHEPSGNRSGDERVVLRPVRTADLDVFFELYSDPGSVTMAGFTPENPTDREAFDAHWRSILAAESITARTIVRGDQVVGQVASFEVDGVTEVTYWIDRRLWGHGIATAALSQLLELVGVRPLQARAASDNTASLRVLTKCGFRAVGTDRAYADARGEEIEETILQLD